MGSCGHQAVRPTACPKISRSIACQYALGKVRCRTNTSIKQSPRQSIGNRHGSLSAIHRFTTRTSSSHCALGSRLAARSSCGTTPQSPRARQYVELPSLEWYSCSSTRCSPYRQPTNRAATGGRCASSKWCSSNNKNKMPRYRRSAFHSASAKRRTHHYENDIRLAMDSPNWCLCSGI